ncbi:MAG: crossover junction endodeoxyribonuclease RuvC [Clostridia bacterium]|nr:crossover junction endodeoxyribonuclease RuvC [Clostridia bacterium]
MIVLGIDPGYATVGFGVVHAIGDRMTALAWGAIQTKPDTPFPDRLLDIHEGVLELIERFKPDALSVEELFFNTNQTTAIGVGQARGVIVLAAAKKKLLIAEYTPLQVKSAVVGYGRAEKKQVMELTRLQLNLPKTPKPDDAADALALAVCHIRSAASQIYQS